MPDTLEQAERDAQHWLDEYGRFMELALNGGEINEHRREELLFKWVTAENWAGDLRRRSK